MAGTWYPNRPEELSGIVNGYLNQVRPVDGVPAALIVPHAGYKYSGSVAAYGFKQLESANIDTAVVIASDHQSPRSRPISVWSKGGYETPFGVLPINEQLAARLIDYDASIQFDPETHSNEHPIEIELPFLKQVSPDCRIVPVMIGESHDEAVRVLVEALLNALPNEGVVVIASSDLSHYPEYEHALEVDEATLVAIESGDPDELERVIQENMAKGIPNLATCACGEAPIRVAMQVAAGRGAETISLLHYSNSGNVEEGDRSRVVGYGAVMFWHYEPPELTGDHQSVLLQLARDAVTTYVRTGVVPQDPMIGPELERLSAVFVTLRHGDKLRGCIGQVRADTPLHQAVREKAVAAATGDPRFPALQESELNEISYEISILSPLDQISSESEVEVGTHGVAVNQGSQRAVLLPKVAAERDWEAETLLENLYAKAGLPTDGWKNPAGLYRFTTFEVAES
ncbi:MAG: AmmeMemoRadiSam system protein B [Anaerolineales bacterium]